MADGILNGNQQTVSSNRRDRMQPNPINRGPDRSVNTATGFIRYNPTPIIASNTGNRTTITSVPNYTSNSVNQSSQVGKKAGPSGPTMNCNISGNVGCGPPPFIAIMVLVGYQWDVV